MSSVFALVGLLTVGIALYVAIALLVHATKPVEFVPTQAPTSRHKALAQVLRPVEAAISCIRDRNEQDWTWQQYTMAALLLVLVSVVVIALLAVSFYVRALV